MVSVGITTTAAANRSDDVVSDHPEQSPPDRPLKVGAQDKQHRVITSYGLAYFCKRHRLPPLLENTEQITLQATKTAAHGESPKCTQVLKGKYDNYMTAHSGFTPVVLPRTDAASRGGRALIGGAGGGQAVRSVLLRLRRHDQGGEPLRDLLRGRSGAGSKVEVGMRAITDLVGRHLCSDI